MASSMVNGVKGEGAMNGVMDHQSTPSTHFDAIVIGTGFAGLRMLYELRGIGIKTKVIEQAPDVGGTWYWNRYPGARTDSESWGYIMNFSKELRSDWVWKERYPTQGDVWAYLRHVADRFDMRRDIEFNTRVDSAHYDDHDGQPVWKVKTSKGDTYTCTYFIPATGPLSAGLKPPYSGLDNFKGEWYQASAWPADKDVDFTGKRVAVIGTGATGVQLVPMVAHNAESLVVFQRTPNYVIPARNSSLTKERRQEIQRTYDQIWETARNQVFGFPIPTSQRNLEDVPDERERRRILEAGWETGGFRYINQTFEDITTNPECNQLASDFVREKIRTVVRDPKTAELLCPKYPLMVKRPPLGHFYYETYNQPNVRLVDISNKGDPIKDFTEKGLRTGKEEFEFDLVVFAIGFDAITGPLSQIDVRGKGGRSLPAEFAKRVETSLGIMVDGYPNMFMMAGPQAPFGNAPVTIDAQATMLGALITYMRDHGHKTTEPTRDAVDDWRNKCEQAYKSTLLSVDHISESVNSWYVGANVPGKHPDILLYFGGIGVYTPLLEDIARNGFPGFKFK